MFAIYNNNNIIYTKRKKVAILNPEDQKNVPDHSGSLLMNYESKLWTNNITCNKKIKVHLQLTLDLNYILIKCCVFVLLTI